MRRFCTSNVRASFSTLGCLALLDGAPAFDALVALLDTRFTVLDRYRHRPVRSFLDLDHPTWVEDPSFQVRRHLRRIAVPAPGGEAELRSVVDALFAAPFDPAHPPWEMHLIEGLAARTGFGCERSFRCRSGRRRGI